MGSYFRAGQYALRCLGIERGSQWLHGRAADGTIELAPSTDGAYAGTRWEVSVIDDLNEIIALKCLGDSDGSGWLDGRTADGTVGLAPTADDGYTGTKWKVHRVKVRSSFGFNNYGALECLGSIPGPKWLCGYDNGTVGLTSQLNSSDFSMLWEKG